MTIGAGQPLTINLPAVLFAFDDWSVPWTRGLALTMLRPEKYPANPVLARGCVSETDAHRACSPSVLCEGGRWRMWYAAYSAQGAQPRVAYAESDDGLTWRKPKLGLVEVSGSRDNNLVAAEPGLCTVALLHDPDAPQERRYVIAGEDMRWWSEWSLDVPSMTRIDVSPDGFHWQPLLDTPGIIAQQNETMTLYRFQGKYHIGGHQISPLLRLPMQEYELGAWLGPRTFVVWRSPRLDRWPPEHTRAFSLPMRSASPYRLGWDREEVHLGATVTSYGNVCLGIYGQWHHPMNEGSPEYHAATVSVDLGLLISNDGLHFREPAPGLTFVARDQELTWDRDCKNNPHQDNILLVQGSLVNTEESTYLYYSASTPGGNVAEVCENIGVAVLPRDRFGYLSTIGGATGQFVTCDLTVEGDARLCVNAEVPDGSRLAFALLDQDGLEELPGFTMHQDGLGVKSGLATPLTWNNRAALPANTPFRIRGQLHGNAKVYALYLKPI